MRIEKERSNLKTAAGFEIIYRRYVKKLFGICYFQTKDEKLAQDMVQDIFYSLWKRRNNLDIKVPIENYLVRAAKLEVMSYYRTKSNRKKKLEIVTCQEDNSTENLILFNELEVEVNSLINKLPLQRKKIFKLSRTKGMSNKEIANILDISEKGVEYHITKALSFLRKHLVVSLR